ncbi:hypothetical protein M9H77_22158 [Catharanthus roseus]|uniref:Uncharacterized protein n=1 Tax=Catharanthus roseus TaxID=4058 RepID=A0ACC0AR59_CATRO|nr:hypothetical protein M9H77_22158 [Catharanthus roseus]
MDVVGKDRISNSPNSMLCFIFSFLPTLHTVRTNLLSKRWKLHWTQVPTIRFNALCKDEISYITQTIGDFMPTLLVSSPSLKKFDLTFSSYYDSMVFEIRAPLLEYLSISNCFKRKLILNSLPSLFEVYIDVNDIYASKETGEISYSSSVTKLVQDVQHTNSLILMHNTIREREILKLLETSSYALLWLLRYFGNATAPLPKLPRLSKFAIKVICCEWNNLHYMLESSVNLEVLILQKAYEDDLQLIKYFLQHGEVLEKIDLYVPNNLNIKAHLKMLKKISVFCRLSPTCEHVLEHGEGKWGSLSDNYGDFYFDAWISVAIARNIRHLEPTEVRICRIKLPVNLFIRKILEFLKLTYLAVIICGRVSLPRIHTIILTDVCFDDNESVPQLLDGCPILQSLSLLSSIEGYMSTLLVSSLSLKRLDISLVNDYELCESEKFEINATSLEYLHISNCFLR